MRVWAWGVGALAVVIAAIWIGWTLMRAEIGMTIFERQVQDMVGTDPSAGLENGLHVYMCGTGSPIPDPSRAGPCVGILAGKSAFVFDAGSGSMRKLMRIGFPIGQVKKAYLTHLHSDHLDGLGELLLQAWIGGNRAQPLPIGGPAGTGEIVAGFNQVYRQDSTYRVAHHGENVANPQGFGGMADEIVFLEGRRQTVVYEGGGVTITAFLVDHEPVSPALGYRIDYADRSVTISGDTVKNETLIVMAKDTDILIHEALNRDMVLLMADAANSNGNKGLAKIFTDITDYHATPRDAAESAERAGADMLVLTHIVPPLPSPLLNPAFVGDARKHYSGALKVGSDGLLISLPSGSDAIHVEQRLN